MQDRSRPPASGVGRAFWGPAWRGRGVMRFTPTCSGADRRRASWFRHPRPSRRAVCVSASKQPGRPGRAHGQPWSQSRGQDSPWGAGAWTCLPPPTLGPTVNTPRPPFPHRSPQGRRSGGRRPVFWGLAHGRCSTTHTRSRTSMARWKKRPSGRTRPKGPNGETSH